jgi:hypothetical protein
MLKALPVTLARLFLNQIQPQFHQRPDFYPPSNSVLLRRLLYDSPQEGSYLAETAIALPKQNRSVAIETRACRRVGTRPQCSEDVGYVRFCEWIDVFLGVSFPPSSI